MKTPIQLEREESLNGIFIPNGKEYTELKCKLKNTSINGITEHLGYKPIEVFTFTDTYNTYSIIQHVIFEVFTENIIFVLAQSTKTLSVQQVRDYTKNFCSKEEYDPLTIRDILLEGIEQKSLSLEFLSRVLDIENPKPNEIYLVKKIGINLGFIEGKLVCFKLDNDLGIWARYFKNINPNLVADYAKNAKTFWGEDYDKVFDEVNLQFRALAYLPNGLKNEFIELHRDKFGTVNFFMLLVCHYRQKINLSEFEIINKGRFQISSTFDSGKVVCLLGEFSYFFNEVGLLINIRKNTNSIA